MKFLAALLSLFVVAWLTLRLRPAQPRHVYPVRAWGIQRGKALRFGRRWVAVRVQIVGEL